MATRGRTPGSTSWWRNPDNVAAHHASALMEMWLAGAPVEAIRALLRPLVDQAQFAGLIDICWSKQPTSRRYAVPKRVKRNLCKLAKAYVEALHSAQQEALKSDYFEGITAGMEANLRDWGVTQAQIDAFLRRTEAAHKDWKRPSLDKVIEIVSRHTPDVTLRRKASSRRTRQ